MTRIAQLLVIGAGLSTGAAQAERASIGFEGPQEGPAPGVMVEDGYSIAMRAMMISTAERSGDGTDGPTEAESDMQARGAMAITRPGVPFVFVSLDWQTESGAATVRVIGYSGGVALGAEEFHLPAGAAAGAFVTFEAEALRGVILDRLVLYPQRDGEGLGALDRIILDDAPEGPETS